MGRAEDLFKMLIEGGREAIDGFIESAASEELFLDFKRSADQGSGTALHTRDRANLAKAISGFGNSEGGVIVWGVDCSPNPRTGDVASEKVPIQRPARFKSWLEGAVSGLTIPPHASIQHHVVVEGKEDLGFVATLVPQSNHAPHQVVTGNQYYMRAGSSFVPVPHAILAGMFGRRPQPRIFQLYTIFPPQRLAAPDDRNGLSLQLGLVLHNEGPGIAEDVFLNMSILSLPGPNCDGAWINLDSSSWAGRLTFGMRMSVISRAEIRLPPEAEVTPFEIKLTFRPPFSDALHFSGVCGCSGAPLHRFEFVRSAGEIGNAAEAFVLDGRRDHLDALFN